MSQKCASEGLSLECYLSSGESGFSYGSDVGALQVRAEIGPPADRVRQFRHRGAQTRPARHEVGALYLAIAMEAASAGETEGLDGNRDSAGLKGIAQTQSDEGMQ